MSANQQHKAPTASQGLPTGRVMTRVIFAGALFAGMIIKASHDTPQLATTGYAPDKVFLDLRSATPPRAAAWQKTFVPAARQSEQRVLKNLATLESQWQERGIKVSVAAAGSVPTATRFAEQVDRWLRTESLAAEAGDNSTSAIPASTRGLVIRCHEFQRAAARELLLALSPLVRGSMAIEYSQQVAPGTIAIRIEGTPEFDAKGIAYFPVNQAGV